MTLWEIFLLVIALVLLGSSACAENTGSMIILQQNVDLFPQNNGDVLIHYDDIIQVTGGDCPWITMGLPTSDFSVVNFSGAASSVVPQNSAGWSGVYVTLDRDYQPGQTFEFQFTADQHGFVTDHDGQASVEITPVWFDDTPITAMTVTFHMPPGVRQVTTSDHAAKFGNGIVYWTFAGLAAGQRETVGVQMPYDGVFAAPARSTATGGMPVFDLPGTWQNILSVLLLIFVIGSLIVRRRNDYEDPAMTLDSALSGKTVHRNLHLRCPNDDTMMDDKSAGDPDDDEAARYAICPACGALFFDRGEIEHALKGGIPPSDLTKGFAKLPVAEGAPPGPVMTCERCGGTMEEVRRTFSGTTAALSFCRDCGGLHLQAGEYDSLLRIHEGQMKELGDKGIPVMSVPNDHWLFYPYIYYPRITGHARDRVSVASGSYLHPAALPNTYACACVSCACVACACACACAGGGHAGCSPKDKFSGISLYDIPDLEHPQG